MDARSVDTRRHPILPERLRAVHRRRHAVSLLWLAGDWVTIAGCALIASLLAERSVVAMLLLIPCFGILQHRLANLGHDGAHFLLCRSRWLNDVVCDLFIFLPLGTRVSRYRQWHFEHHRHLGTEHDPERVTKVGNCYQLPKSKRALLVDFIKNARYGGLREQMLLLREIGPSRQHAPIIGGYWAVIAAVGVYTGTVPFLVCWWLAFFSTFWAIFQARAFFEHTGSLDTHRFVVPWYWRYAVFPYNTWCHFEHHRWSGVPWYNLPACRALDDSRPVLTVSDLLKQLPVSHAQ